MIEDDKKPGLHLADLAKRTEDVPVGDSHISVSGISVEKALDILKRFPALAKMANGFKLPDLIAIAPGALASIIATGCGQHGDKQAEADAANIPIEYQLDIVEAIGRLTFKNGFAPFAQRVLGLAASVKSDLYTKVPSMNLPVTSKPSSPLDTEPKPSSDTPQDKSAPSAT